MDISRIEVAKKSGYREGSPYYDIVTVGWRSALATHEAVIWIDPHDASVESVTETAYGEDWRWPTDPAKWDADQHEIVDAARTATQKGGE